MENTKKVNHESGEISNNFFDLGVHCVRYCQLLGNGRVFTSAFVFLAISNVLGSNSRFLFYCFLGHKDDR